MCVADVWKFSLYSCSEGNDIDVCVKEMVKMQDEICLATLQHIFNILISSQQLSCLDNTKTITNVGSPLGSEAEANTDQTPAQMCGGEVSILETVIVVIFMVEVQPP